MIEFNLACSVTCELYCYNYCNFVRRFSFNILLNEFRSLQLHSCFGLGRVKTCFLFIYKLITYCLFWLHYCVLIEVNKSEVFSERGFCRVTFKLMTYSPTTFAMPTHARCDRVPPADGSAWDALDLRVLQEDDLPLDPRTWGRPQVGAWVSRRGGMAERFPMNGKALCLMSKEMFTARVPGKGHVLYQDFRRRLAKALALQEFIEKMTSK